MFSVSIERDQSYEVGSANKCKYISQYILQNQILLFKRMKL